MRTDPDTDSISFLIVDVARLVRAEFDRRTSEAGLGLTPGEARALSHAARAGSVRQAALAESMGIEAMTLSVYLDRLEARGLVRRAPDPTDRRAKLVHVTDEARPVLEEVVTVGIRLRADIARLLAPSQMEEFRESLTLIRASLVAMRPDCSKAGNAA